MSEIKKTDARGNVIYSRDEAGEDFHKYDEHGREIYSYYFDGSGHFSEYDEHGRETKRVVFDLSVTTYDGNGEWSSTAYEYDDNGNLLRERAYTTNYDLYREQIRANNNEIRAQIEQSAQPQKQLSKARQALVDRVLARLDEGAIPWDNGMQGSFEKPRNAITGKQYSGMNVLNLMLAFKSDPRWLTFNQARDNGYTVKKGAKGVPIELYKTIDKRTGADADFDAIREEIKDMTFAERQAFKKENLQTFARSYYVFNASDVHGIEPYRAPEQTPRDISARNERIERVISDSQAPIFYDGNGRNYYIPTTDEIHLTDRNSFKSDEFFYNTALHEMAHSTGHSSRLNRPCGTFGTKEYAREELVAEISSVLTAAEFGLNHSDRVIENSAEYVRSWAKLIRDNPQALIDATFDASRATDHLCDAERQREQTEEKTQKESGTRTTQTVQLRMTAAEQQIFKGFLTGGNDGASTEHQIVDFGVERPQSKDFWIGLAMLGEVEQSDMSFSVHFDRTHAHSFTIVNDLQSLSKENTQKESVATNKAKPAPASTHELKTNLDHIPDVMKALPNWVAFRTETLEGGKVKKILLSPNKGANAVEYLKWAKSDDPTTWASFDKAVSFAKKYKLDGLAFAMSGSGMTCIDLDHHLDEHGKPSELAQKFIDAAQGTYIEKSVSGRGLHIFYVGARPSNRQNRNIELDLETYDSGRFMSMTGNLYDNAPKAVNPPSDELKNVLASNLAKLQQYSMQSTPLGMDDSALIEKIRSSKVGHEFDALWRGENTAGDHSVSDFRLCNMLAFFSGGDVAQVERVFKSSGLYRPQKGDAYVRRTAEKACRTLRKTYSPKPVANNTKKNSGKPGGNGSNGSPGR